MRLPPLNVPSLAQWLGFALVVAGVWLWSPTAALVVAGTLLFIAGGLAQI